MKTENLKTIIEKLILRYSNSEVIQLNIGLNFSITLKILLPGEAPEEEEEEEEEEEMNCDGCVKDSITLGKISGKFINEEIIANITIYFGGKLQLQGYEWVEYIYVPIDNIFVAVNGGKYIDFSMF